MKKKIRQLTIEELPIIAEQWNEKVFNDFDAAEINMGFFKVTVTDGAGSIRDFANELYLSEEQVIKLKEIISELTATERRKYRDYLRQLILIFREKSKYCISKYAMRNSLDYLNLKEINCRDVRILQKLLLTDTFINKYEAEKILIRLLFIVLEIYYFNLRYNEDAERHYFENVQNNI